VTAVASDDRTWLRRCLGGVRERGVPLNRESLLVALMVALMVAHVVLKILLFPRTAHGDVVGDERFYLDGGRALSNLVRDLVALRSPDSSELSRDVIGNGWFMPGMSLVLTPLFIVVPDASIEVTRAYLGITSVLMFFAAVLAVRRVLGVPYALALLVFPGLVPMWVIFSYAAWGDLAAGVVIVLLVVEVVAISRLVQRGVAPTLGQGVRLGLLAIAVVYLRSSALLLVLGLVATLVIVAGFSLPRGQRGRGLVAFAAAAAAAGALLAPWSWAASDVLGTRVVTTTSVPTGLANTFGEPDRLCFGPCDPDSSEWFGPVRYAREVARATGRSEVEILRQMSDHALVGVTPSSYSDDVVANVDRYVTEPERYQRSVRSPGVSEADASERLLSTGTRWMFFTALIAGLLGLLRAWRGPFDRQMLRVATTIGLAALFIQPFVHVAGARYWTTAAPLLALSAVLLVPGARPRSTHPAGEAATPGDTASAPVTNLDVMRGLHIAQIALTAAMLLIGLALFTVANA